MASRSRTNSPLSTNSSTYFIWHLLSDLAVQLGHPPHHLLRRHILHMRRDGPPVPERINDVAVPVTVELILRRALQCRAECHGVGYDRVDVLNVDEQGRWRAGQAAGRWCLGPALRVLVLDDHDGIPDLDLGVGDGPVRPGEAHALGRAEHGCVKFEGLRGTLDGEAGRDTAIRIRDRVGPCWCCHPVLLHDEVRCPSTNLTIGLPPVTTTARELPRDSGADDALNTQRRSLVIGCLGRFPLLRPVVAMSVRSMQTA